MFGRMTIGRRISSGFTVMVALIIASGAITYWGVGGIVHDAQEVITGNQLDGVMAQKEVDHLNWVSHVSALLTDDHITKLDVQTDPHKCALGTWLDSAARLDAEAAIPSIQPLLKQLEKEHAALHASAVHIGEVFVPADAKLPQQLREREIDHLDWIDHIQELFLENRAALDIETDPSQCALGKWMESESVRVLSAADSTFDTQLAELRDPHARLHASAREISGIWRKSHPGLIEELKDRLEDHRRWTAKVCRACVLESDEVDVEFDPTRCAFGEFLAGDACEQWCAEFPALREALDACREPHTRLHESAARIQQAFADEDTAAAKRVYTRVTAPTMDAIAENLHAAIAAEEKLVAAQAEARELYQRNALPALHDVRTKLGALQDHAIHALDGMREANRIFSTSTKTVLASVQDLLHQVRDEIHANVMTDEEMLATARGTKSSVMWIGGIATLIGVVLAGLIKRGIVRPLHRLIGELRDGAAQVSDASGQLSSASQSIAEAASVQASSLEETSAALEELLSQSRTNSESAIRANEIANSAQDSASTGEQTMTQLNTAMRAINDSSDKINAINKTIEEIAFQTNLLALNAAVEAARAGEHGKGFAVVAGEVRTLAQRAADAARETTSLIEESVHRAREGNDVAASASHELQSIAGNVSDVARLLEGIATASKEQVQGIDQLNAAATQMDQATQQNAAAAEQCASSSEELTSMAASLKNEMIGELVAMVEGRGAGKQATTSPTTYASNAAAEEDSEEADAGANW